MTVAQGEQLQSEMFNGVQAGIDQFIHSDLMVVFSALLSIALLMLAYTWILKIISSRELEAKTAVLRNKKIDDDIQGEVDEYNRLDRGIAVASVQNDSARVAIYKKRQSVVVNSAARKLGRLHFK